MTCILNLDVSRYLLSKKWHYSQRKYCSFKIHFKNEQLIYSQTWNQYYLGVPNPGTCSNGPGTGCHDSDGYVAKSLKFK